MTDPPADHAEPAAPSEPAQPDARGHAAHHRHAGRALALRALYQADVLGEPRAQAVEQVLEDPSPMDPDEIAAYLDAHPEEEPPAPRPADPSLGEFVKRLVGLVEEHLAEIDGAIQAAAAHWTLARMAAVDRNILRLGTAEILYCPDVPVRVALNEAILLAKRYGGADSGAFVNGILDQVAHRARATDAGQAET